MSKTLFPTTSAEGAKEKRLTNCNALENQTTRRILPVVPAVALALAFAFSLPQLARAEPIHVGNVPFNIKVPAGNHAYLVGHGVGTQNYVCAPSASSATGVAYALFTPQATLFNDDSKQLITHYFSPSPSETNTNPAVVAPGAIRVTWQHRDTSIVFGRVRPADPTVPGDIGDSSTDEAFVAKGAVAWLKVTATATQEGPTGGDTLTKTTFIQRLNTSGGLAPTTGCSTPTDVGHQAFVPYKADYFFYKADTE
jgi:hypothetical protein